MKVRLTHYCNAPEARGGPGQDVDVAADVAQWLLEVGGAVRVEATADLNSGEARAGARPPATSDGAVIDDHEPEPNGVRLPDGVEADTPLEELDLSDSIVAALAEHSPSLTTAGHVVVFCEDHELTDIAGIGRSSAKRIAAVIGLT